MYLKTLQINTPNETIRDIKFHNGLNIIVDNTLTNNNRIQTENNDGITTI